MNWAHVRLCIGAQARKRQCLTLKISILMAQKKKPAPELQERTVKVVETTEMTEKELFLIINHNGEFMVALGNSVVSKEKFASREEAEKYVDSKPWELILNSCAVMMEMINKQKEQSK